MLPEMMALHNNQIATKCHNKFTFQQLLTQGRQGVRKGGSGA